MWHQSGAATHYEGMGLFARHVAEGVQQSLAPGTQHTFSIDDSPQARHTGPMSTALIHNKTERDREGGNCSLIQLCTLFHESRTGDRKSLLCSQVQPVPGLRAPLPAPRSFRGAQLYVSCMLSLTVRFPKFLLSVPQLVHL